MAWLLLCMLACVAGIHAEGIVLIKTEGAAKPIVGIGASFGQAPLSLTYLS
jgi:hypothetical protein